MSNWIDWHFEQTKCPNCSNTFKVLWVEAAASVSGEIKTVGKDTNCPKCNTEFNIDNIQTTEGGEIQCSQQKS